MKSLPLIVLVSEGPQARAYLSRMRHAGIKPDRILLVVSNCDAVTKKPVGKWLPQKMRISYAEKDQEVKNNYWSRRIKMLYPFLVEAIMKETSRLCEPVNMMVDEMLGPFRYEDYADKVERVFVSGLSDRVLRDALAKIGSGTVLFTGGGILRPNLLDLPGFRFIHIHPGYLPYVLGADGLLWSLLVRGRIGMSAFYMANTIDKGDIIAAQEYATLSFDISERPRPDEKILYRAIFSFLDPVLRAEFFVSQVLTKGGDMSALPSFAQDSAKGITYHFMNRRLLNKTLALLFKTHKRELTHHAKSAL